MNTQDFPLNSPITNPNCTNEDENLIARSNDLDDEKAPTFVSQLVGYQSEKTPKFFFNSPSIPTQIPPTNSQQAGHSRSDSLQLVNSNFLDNHTVADPYNKYGHLSSYQLDSPMSTKLKEIDDNLSRHNAYEADRNFIYQEKNPHSSNWAPQKRPKTSLAEINDIGIAAITEEASNLKITISNNSKNDEQPSNPTPVSITRAKAATTHHPKKDRFLGFQDHLAIPKSPHHQQRHSDFLPRTSWMKAEEKAKIGNSPKPRKSILDYFKKPDSLEETSCKALEIIKDKAFVKTETNTKFPRRKTHRRHTTPKLVSLMRKHASAGGQVGSDENLKFFKLMKQVKSLNMGNFAKFKGAFGEFVETVKNKFYVSPERWRKLAAPFHPAGMFRLCWDIMVMIWIVYGMILYPFRLSFEAALDSSEKVFDFLDNIQNIFFLIDICLNFHTAYYHDGTLVFDQKKIVNNYLRGWFLIDLIASVPYEWLDGDIWDAEHTSSEDTSIIKGLRLLKLVRMLRIYKVKQFVGGLPDFLYNRPSIHGILSLIKLSLIICFLAHWCACGWQYIVVHSEGDNWLEGYSPNSYQDQYIASLYFAMTTMLTVGFGDITPGNSTQRVYTIFMMLLGGGVFGYAMNRIAVILQSLEDEKSKLRKKILAMTRFMQKKGFGRDVQQEVVKYLEFIHEDNTMNQNEKEMFNMLSQDLKSKLYEHMNGRLLYENKVMCSNFSRKLLYLVSSKIETQTYAPGEEIFSSNDCEYRIYFIVKGHLELFFPKSQTAWLSLKKESHFGEFSFFTQSPRIFQAKSVDFTHLIFLRRDRFLESLEQFPHDREMFCMLQDKLLVYQDFSVLKLKCGACENTDHILETCPQVRYVPNKELVIREYLEDQEKMGINFIRRQRTKFHTRLSMPLLVAAQNQINSIYPLQLQEIEKDNEVQESHDVAEEISINQQLVSKSKIGLETDTKAKAVIRSLGKILTVYSERDKSPHNRSLIKRLTQTMKLYNQTLIDGDLLKDLEHDIYAAEDSFLQDEFEDFEFDKIMNFPVYFPHNNFTKIIDRMGKKGKLILEHIEENQKLRRHLARFFKAIDKGNRSLSDSETTSPRRLKDPPKVEVIASP